MKQLTIAIWLNLAAFAAIFSFSILVYSNDTPTAASRMLAVLVYVTLFVLPIISVDVMRPMKLSYGLIAIGTCVLTLILVIAFVANMYSDNALGSHLPTQRFMQLGIFIVLAVLSALPVIWLHESRTRYVR